MESWENHGEKTKGQGGTRALKNSDIDRGHPQAVSGIGENGVTPQWSTHGRRRRDKTATDRVLTVE